MENPGSTCRPEPGQGRSSPGREVPELTSRPGPFPDPALCQGVMNEKRVLPSGKGGLVLRQGPGTGRRKDHGLLVLHLPNPFSHHAASVSRHAVRVLSKSSSMWAKDTKQASNWDGGRLIPRSSIPRNQRAKASVSLFAAVA